MLELDGRRRVFGVYYSDFGLSFTILLKGRRKKLPQPEKINGEFPEQDSAWFCDLLSRR